MELLKIINRDLYWRKALNRLEAQFPQIKLGDSDKYEVEWFHEVDRPYVMILNCYRNGKIDRKEFYEYYKGNWNYVGYLPREACIKHYRWQAWQKNKQDFPTYEAYMRYTASRSTSTTDEQAAERFPESYFKRYPKLDLKKE